MNEYEVVSECYVPSGSGFRYKRLGQIVTLSDEHAAALAGYVKPVDPSGGVAKRNTEPEAVEQPFEQPFEQPLGHTVEEITEGVSSDVGDPAADYE